MTLKAKILEDIKQAMISKDAQKRDALRMISANIKQVEVDQRVEADDALVLGLLKTTAKQRQDAIDSYKKAGREDLAQKEEYELKLIESYMPAQLSDDELKAKIEEIIKQVGATSLKDLGAVMKETKALSDVASGKRISECVKNLLS
ncbi:GatB/YqeY domain-containing protein [Helicobacter sp. 11S02629-2]|uniref:GatB/YqeY domain-containing protein n=1 Tax=Helicobacter sp. 11S02629-2 TaxID=1476195 RepID=UPI000BA54EF7|nr:GatB/YqeY domain-containing protein [Helicobacter sp. 11S02629-2]PAF43653.1 glutamyl-tRNA amidotransferase [Helicobacter sp. 11S02629-2]